MRSTHCAEKPSQRYEDFIEPVMMKPVSGARNLFQFGSLEMREQAGGLGVGTSPHINRVGQVMRDHKAAYSSDDSRYGALAR